MLKIVDSKSDVRSSDPDQFPLDQVYRLRADKPLVLYTPVARLDSVSPGNGAVIVHERRSRQRFLRGVFPRAASCIRRLSVNESVRFGASLIQADWQIAL